MKWINFLLLSFLLVGMMIGCGDNEVPLPEGGILWVKGQLNYRISALNVFDGNGLQGYGIEVEKPHDIVSFSVDRNRGAVWVVDEDENFSNKIYKFSRNGENLGTLILNMEGKEWRIENIGACENDGGCWINYREIGGDIYYWGRVSSDIKFIGGKQVPVTPGFTGSWVVNKVDGSLWFSPYNSRDIHKWDSDMNEIGALKDVGYFRAMDVDEKRGYIWAWIEDNSDKEILIRIDSNAQKVDLVAGNPTGDQKMEEVFLFSDESDGGVYMGCSFKNSQNSEYESYVYKIDINGKLIGSMKINLGNDETVGIIYMAGNKYDQSLFFYGSHGYIPVIWKISSDLSSIVWSYNWTMFTYKNSMMEVEYRE